MVLNCSAPIEPGFVDIAGLSVPVFRFNTVVVGTGCAGYNAADTLHALGQTDVAIVTEGVNMGTSRNTGSDKQTYYKLTLAGGGGDSVRDMASTLFEGGAMHGDTALVEAALSARCFYRLANLGVPFPHNRWGEYVGYKTDHDPRRRATSCGPLTSRLMTERLQKSVEARGIPVFDGYRVVSILTDGEGEKKRAIGLLALDTACRDAAGGGLALFACTNVVYATGGPSALYYSSVYPESQTCATGTALAAGARGVNLTESQYGIASVKFRWNLSGTYQQVVPTYISTDGDGDDEREFLDGYFESPWAMMDAIFLKGYQWPFDPRKLGKGGSSLVDIAVFRETQRGRRVFLDFRVNPSRGGDAEGLNWNRLSSETFGYLEKSGALLPAPIDRLTKMNPPAYELYRNNGIDLRTERLEIAVCAQHNNGGLAVNEWWESNIKNLFPVGEVAGTLGVYRPGGSALNSTQVGSTRAAQYIAANCGEAPIPAKALGEIAAPKVGGLLALIQRLSGAEDGKRRQNPFALRAEYQREMDACGAFIRPKGKVEYTLMAARRRLAAFADETRAENAAELVAALINRDVLIARIAYLSAIAEYIKKGGKSRGSYLICDSLEALEPDSAATKGLSADLDDGRFSNRTCEVAFDSRALSCTFEWKEVRPIPNDDDWFENVWNAYVRGEVVRQEGD